MSATNDLGTASPRWVRHRLKHISSLKGRLGWQGLTADEYRDEGPHVVSSAHFKNQRVDWSLCPRVSQERYEVDWNIQLATGDILLMKDGAALGKLAFLGELPGPACLNSHLLLLRPQGGSYSPRFLFYVLTTEQFQGYLVVNGTGSTFMGVSQESIGNFELTLPPVADQLRITDFLDRKTAVIDELIAKKERLVELLAEKRQALITQAVTKGLDPNVPMKESGVTGTGKIPAHWLLKRLRYISPRISGRLVFQPAQYFVDSGVPFLMGNNITEDGIDWSNLKYVTEETNETFVHHALRTGDIVTVRVGAPGVTCVVPKEANGLNCASMMIVRRSPGFDSDWLAFVMNSPVIKVQIDLVQYGAAQEQINISDAVNFVVPLPPIEEQKRIGTHLSRVIGRIRELQLQVRESLARLREYRQAIIAAAVTGRVELAAEDVHEI